MRNRHPGRSPDAVRITTAPISRSSDVRSREKRYLISMAIRTVCFIGAVVAGPGLGITWLMWVLIAASLFLPYVAVVMANAASPHIDEADLDAPIHDYRAIDQRKDRP